MDAGATFLTALPSTSPVSRQSAPTALASVDRAHQPTLRPPTVLAVAALHIACVAAFCLVFQPRQMPPPPADNAVPVVFTPATHATHATHATPMPPDPTPQILASGTVPPQADTVADTLSPPPPVSMMVGETGLLPPPKATRRTPAHASRQTSLNLETARKPTPSTQAPTTQAPLAEPASAMPTTRAVTAPAAAPSSLSTDAVPHALTSWEARIRQAVQNAAIYPASARLLHREGSAQIRFDYDRGTVEDASITRTSQSAALDNAALAAVTRAAIPDPPAELGPQKRVMLVWVQFKLVATE